MKTFCWWAYILVGVALFGFLGPALISAADTFAVLSGVVLVLLYGTLTWHFWVKGLINKLKESIRD